MRAVSVAFSPDLPSRRKNEPGILPAAYIALLDVDGEGKEVHVAQAADGCGAEDHRVAGLDDDRATRLLREFARLEGNLAVADIHRDAAYVKHAHLVVLPPAARLAAIRFLQNSRSLTATKGTGIEHRRSAGDSGADAGLEVAPHPRGRPVASGGRASKRSRSRPRRSRPLPEVRVVDVAAVGVERVDHLEEAALGARRLRGGVQRRRARVLAGDREVAEGDPRRAGRDLGPGGGAVRAAEVGVDDQPSSPSPRTWSSGPIGGTAALVRSVIGTSLP